MPVVSSKARRHAAALLVVVLFCTACDAERGEARNSPFAAYLSCLAENGVTIEMPEEGPAGLRPSGLPGGGARPSGAPDRPGARPSGRPEPDGSGGPRGGMFTKPADVDDATWAKAQSACASERPGMGAARGGTNRAYLNCLKENGVPDPGTVDTADPATRKAVETCKILQPSAAAPS